MTPTTESAESSVDGEIRVLHVDDEPGFVEMAAEFLEREDPRFTVATEAATTAALERLESTEFDCVVSDYDMPERNGVGLLETVRETHPELPFILFTGKGSEEVASEAISAGVTDYLQKEGGTEQYAILANRIANAVERVRSQRALAKRKRRLETLIGNLPGIVYRCRNDPGWPMELVEGECRALTGYSAAAIERGDVVWGEDVIHPDDRAAMWDAVQEALDADESFEVTYRIETADGETRWMWERGSGVYTNGEIDALEGFITDVTDRVAYEDELQQFEMILDTSGDPVYALDAEGRFTYVNDSLVETVGYPAEELLGEHASIVLPDGDIDYLRSVVESLVSSDEQRRTVEIDVVTAAGERVPCELHVSVLLSDGSFRGTVGVVRDISERMERERKLDRLRDRTQRLMYTESTVETAEIATTAADDIIGAPLSAVHLLNEAGDVIEPCATVDSVTDYFEEAPRYRRDAPDGTASSLIWQVFESGEPLRIDDTDAYDPLTEPRPAKSVILHPIGRHGVFIVSSGEPNDFDDTEETLVELLATSLRTALDRVERETELRRQRNELRARNERLDQFASVISHDLRNPLNVASGHLELAREEIESSHLDAVAGAHDRMISLVDDLLTIAREGDAATELQSVDLAALADDCWQSVETADSELELPDEHRIRADPGRTRQLLENLFRNAVEHGSTRPRSQTRENAAAHGGTDEAAGDADSDRLTVRVGTLEDGFYVEDDGVGIPPAERAQVFDVGYSTSQEGTGFGLAIVQQVADAHGWAVSVTDGTAGGARFEVRNVESA